MRKREMIRGARTSADDQPAVVPDVVAKMSKTRATEKTIHERSGFPLSGMLTGEIKSRLWIFSFVDILLSSARRFEGMRRTHSAAIGMVETVINQKHHLHDAYCTKRAPIKRPMTGMT
jgi:hypothetical protein